MACPIPFAKLGKSSAEGKHMYQTILITLDTTPTDRAIITHIKALASIMESSVVLLHVADGWAARTFGPDAVSPEVIEDKAYLEQVRTEFLAAGMRADAFLAYGDPVKEIIRWVQDKHVDLVAMSTHGHRFLADIFYGTTASRVQHSIDVPMLLIRAS
jgi:nucleotide-binding universal stress UspA family protein